MKTLTVRLPESLISQIETESRARRLSKSDVVRERLSRAPKSKGRHPATFQAISDLVGTLDELPTDLSRRTKRYLKATGYGRKRTR